MMINHDIIASEQSRAEQSSIILLFISEDMTYVNKALSVLVKQYDKIMLKYVSSASSNNINITNSNGINLQYIHPQDLKKVNYDYLLICGGKDYGVSNIVKMFSKFDIDPEKVFYDWIVCIPGFTKKKYDKLCKSQLSIVSMNCFGGIISHTLGLPFRSPFVNMFFSEEDFLKVLKNFDSYMHKEIKFVRMDYEQNLKREYPVFAFGDGITLNMNHYTDRLDAENKWYERIKRLNYYNTLVVMYTDDINILKEFDKLPFSKKCCFVPFETDIECAFTVDVEKDFNKKDMQMWEVANYYAHYPFKYDVFDLLNYAILR